MILKDVIYLVNNIVDETDYDIQVETIIKNAINYAYLTIASKIDRRSELIDITYSKVLKLPKDCNSVIDILCGNDVLSQVDYSLKSDSIIFHSDRYKTGLKLLYNKNISPVTSETSELDIDERYCFACAMYGAYAYSIHKKRIELASLLLSDYNNLISNDSTSSLEVNQFDTSRYTKLSE